MRISSLKIRPGLPVIILLLFTCSWLCGAALTLDAKTVRDKIKGGWVGQTVGCTYGGPTEFDWQGTWIQDYVPIAWDENRLLWYYENSPGLYDDLYMDMAFLAVLDSAGLEAPVSALAQKFAHAGFRLWHANQAARWNILNGVLPPESGDYRHNPHADDIDFQIESDFIGLLCPGMPVTALQYADQVGHIMNYGDGVYGGVFVSAMYTHAFVESDIPTVIQKALLSLPPESKYYRCIIDVLSWWKQYPDDWRQCWYEVQLKWSEEVGCPEGALHPFDIDAVINGAYIVIGLLYGGGDFGRTLEVATRCGQDSDCNPSNAGGILGALLGFEKIPERWKLGLDKVEKLKFSYSNYSLENVYRVNYKLAAEMVKKNGGTVNDSAWTIQTQEPKAPDKLEVSFEGLTPVRRVSLENRKLENSFTTTFEGRGFVVEGRMADNQGQAECEVLVDGVLIEKVILKGDLHDRRTPLFWNYDLAEGKHTLELKKTGGDGLPQLSNLLIYR